MPRTVMSAFASGILMPNQTRGLVKFLSTAPITKLRVLAYQRCNVSVLPDSYYL